MNKTFSQFVIVVAVIAAAVADIFCRAFFYAVCISHPVPICFVSRKKTHFYFDFSSAPII